MQFGKIQYRALGSRLILSYLLLIFIFLGCALIYGLVQSNKSEVHQYENALIYIENDYLSFSRDLEEFISNGHKADKFYLSNGAQLSQLIRQYHINMDRRIDELKKLGLQLNLRVESQISSISNINERIFRDLEKLKSLIIKRGYKDFGSVGEMRRFAHQLEAAKLISPINLLQLRRLEKNYLLRGDERDILEFRALANQFITQNGRQKNESVFSSYLDNFNKLVQLDKEIGVRGKLGLYPSIIDNIAELRFKLAEVIAISKLRIEEKIYLTKNLLYLLIAFGSITLITLSILMSRLLSKDLSQLSDQMDLLEEKDFSKPELLPAINANILEVENINNRFKKLSYKFNKVLELLEKAKKKAETVSDYKSMFLANMSHEIRTPLNGIIGMVHIMQDEPLSEGQKRYMDIISFSADHLLSLVNMILDYSKIDAGKLELEITDFDLSKDLEKICSIFNLSAQEKDIDLVLENHLAPSYPVKGDSLRVHQILINLINNAIKFTEKGEVRVIIEMSDNDSLVKVTVKDTGSGIPEEKIESILEAFEQSDKSTTREYGGTGLGLAISNQLLKLMGSKLEIYSEVNNGSSFSFEIKLPKSKQAAVPVKQSIQPKSEGFKVLIAEDNPINQEVMELLLAKYRLEITMVENGQEAIDNYNRRSYDLVFLDLNMPVKDGWEAASEIRSSEKYQRLPTPIIAVTANAFKSDKDSALAKGFDDFIGKPVQPAEISRVLEQNGLENV